MEALGDDPALDAEVVASGCRASATWADRLRALLTSLGDDTCRPQYRELLVEFLAKLDRRGHPAPREINPLRVLDDSGLR